MHNKQNSQSGQALVEYILLVAIAVAIILGLASQLYKPFSSWANDYMGQYLECLLDMGELPTIGGGTVSGTCNSKFKSFSVTQGRPPVSSGKNSSDDSDDENSGGKERVRRSDESGATTAGGGDGSRGGRRSSIGRNNGADGPSESQGEKQLTEPLASSQYYRLRSSNSSSMTGGGPGAVSDKTTVVALGRSQIKDRQAKSVQVPTELETEGRGKGKKLLIKAEDRKIAAEAEEEPWSFGQYIKFALMILIIIAIVLFLGGQILQISKGMEK